MAAERCKRSKVGRLRNGTDQRTKRDAMWWRTWSDALKKGNETRRDLIYFSMNREPNNASHVQKCIGSLQKGVLYNVRVHTSKKNNRTTFLLEGQVGDWVKMIDVTAIKRLWMRMNPRWEVENFEEGGSLLNLGHAWQIRARMEHSIIPTIW